MVDKTYSAGSLGLEAFIVEVETNISKGLPFLNIVGLPNAAVKESKERVYAVFQNCGFQFPMKRVTMNLGPATWRKEGPIYDLPFFISLLKSTGQLDCNTDDSVFVGELSLSGAVRPMSRLLPMVSAAKAKGFRRFFMPAENAQEAAVIRGIQVYPVAHVQQLLAHLVGKAFLSPALPKTSSQEQQFRQLPDFADVQGQTKAKRAMEIAASGGHNLLMIGPPGSGKSMLAQRLPSIMPPMTAEESIETTTIHSVLGLLPEDHGLVETRPFRSPHHTTSAVALIGGGQTPRPGEISMAHNGILFLDEFPEFARNVVEALRQPMEDGKVTISRAAASVSFPTRFMLVAAMNPCPCGNFGHPTLTCTCSPKVARQYLNRVSGPMLDRLDLHVEVPPVRFDQLINRSPGESSATIRARVRAARQRQQKRYQDFGIHCNAALPAQLVPKVCRTSPQVKPLLQKMFQQYNLSARGHNQILKVARTIADLADSEIIQPLHVAEAVHFRSLDRKFWHQT